MLTYLVFNPQPRGPYTPRRFLRTCENFKGFLLILYPWTTNYIFVYLFHWSESAIHFCIPIIKSEVLQIDGQEVLNKLTWTELASNYFSGRSMFRLEVLFSPKGNESIWRLCEINSEKYSKCSCQPEFIIKRNLPSTTKCSCYCFFKTKYYYSKTKKWERGRAFQWGIISRKLPGTIMILSFLSKPQYF